MGRSRGILLTGATGFLGRYLLRDLLLAGRQVAVLVRATPSAGAQERVQALMAFWNETLQTKLPNPVVLFGDLHASSLGLGLADRNWLAAHCQTVIHAAAQIALGQFPRGEPWETNVEGTLRLLALCRDLGLSNFHHVSTAFVCGDRTGTIYESELDCGQSFHNDYEESKFEAERCIRRAHGLHTTVYRPSVIVGDSQTGYTSSYHGLYRFLELAYRLAQPLDEEQNHLGATNPSSPARRGRRFLPLRLPFTGLEPRNLVPVDWLAHAMVQIVQQSRWHGLTYHLAAQEPICAQAIKHLAETLLHVEGVQWSGPGPIPSPTRLEEMFLDHIREFWPYLEGDPDFDCRHTRRALPHWPTCIDDEVLIRLIQYAWADRWGRAKRTPRQPPSKIDCSHYIEYFFPKYVRQSFLAQVPLDVAVGLEICGPGGGQWRLRWASGDLVEIHHDLERQAEVLYRTDVATFEALVQGRQSPQEAFFDQRLEMLGDMEKALKLAVLFEQFVREHPYHSRPMERTLDAVS